MRVFKFGGASVKSPEAVQNVKSILKGFNDEKLVVVVSAMGKSTNKLEKLIKLRQEGLEWEAEFNALAEFHTKIVSELELNEEHAAQTNDLIDELKENLTDFNFGSEEMAYDHIVSFGEMLSTTIIAGYLVEDGISCEWMDVRNVIKTDSSHSRAKVDWDKSSRTCKVISDHLNDGVAQIVLTQGFIGSSSMGNTTTLGREGSDFSAAIIAHLIDAEEVIIWKDVPGMLNADPKWFNNTVKLDEISFKEAIELSYYGAYVIHPKTIKPLQNKGIKLKIRSFVNPTEEGTTIGADISHDANVPLYIFKGDQTLISFGSRDFSFIAEENLRDIFEILFECGININLMQNSAISFSICVDKNESKFQKLSALCNNKFSIKYNEGVELLTIRYYDESIVKNLTDSKEVLLEQRSRQMLRLILR